MRALSVLVVFALLALPTAAARSDVAASLDLHDGGTMIAAGALAFAGRFDDAFVVAEADGSRFGPSAVVDVVTGRPEGGLPFPGSGSRETHRDVTVVIESGGFVSTTDRPYALDAAAEHALVVAAPPLASGGSSLVMVSGALRGGFTPARGEAIQLIPFDARVTLLAEDGNAVAGWSSRPVNEGLGPSMAGGDEVTAFVIEGLSAAQWTGAIAVVPMGGPLDARQATVDLRPARSASVAATMDRLATVAEALGPSFFGDDTQRQALVSVAPFINGAFVVVPGAGAEDRRVTVDGAELPLGRALVLRGDGITASWTGTGQGTVRGTPDLVFANSAFVTADVPSVFDLVPVLAFALWVAAVAAYVARILKKPPPPRLALGRRAIAFAVYVGGLVVSFVLWDVAFAGATGASALSSLGETGVGPGFLLLLGLQSLTWTIAFIAFGLPVAILAATAMRYAGLGKEWNRITRVAGFAAALALGSGMILWILNRTVVAALLNLL
ncbi:MAG TPA: hypothetical protein VM889_13765 [Candidatus Thermoplasmatota archaeon]|nr:hypothetical protein [Candidatus Thermoplasmatota archaeon]